MADAVFTYTVLKIFTINAKYKGHVVDTHTLTDQETAAHKFFDKGTK